MNFLEETKVKIKLSKHTPNDIIFIGSEVSGHSCTWTEFEKLADIEYDEDYGAQKVAEDLIIVFSDGAQMRRYEYDGSEEWEFSSPFIKPKKIYPITKLIVGDDDSIGWVTLKELNKHEVSDAS